MIKHKCRGVRLTGVWRGYSCGAPGKVQHLGQWFCANHILVRTTAPEKFDEAIAYRRRREGEVAGSGCLCHVGRGPSR